MSRQTAHNKTLLAVCHMENTGFVTLHRKIKNWEWYQDSLSVHLFIHLLLSANHKDNKWQGIIVKRGQLITGINKLSSDTGISKQSIRTRLDKFVKTKEISVESTNKFTVITIVKYDFYQSENRSLTIKQQTANKQLTTNNNVNNLNNYNKPKQLDSKVVSREGRQAALFAKAKQEEDEFDRKEFIEKITRFKPL